MGLTIIMALSVIPAILLMVFVYSQDSHEKEPIGLIMKIFGLGVLTILPIMVVELIGEIILRLLLNKETIIYCALKAFFVVGLVEEFFKFMAAYLPTWKNKEFNYKFDGLIYCIAASMGFSAIENVEHIIVHYLSGETPSLLRNVIGRGLFAVPGHAMCAIFMGYFYGQAKLAHSMGDKTGCKNNLIKGYLIAASLHAFYDFCCFTERPAFIAIFYVFVLVADIFTILQFIKAKKQDMQIYGSPQYKEYWVTPPVYPMQPQQMRQPQYSQMQPQYTQIQTQYSPQQSIYSQAHPQPAYGQVPPQPAYGQTRPQPVYSQAPQQPVYGQAPQQPAYAQAPQQPAYGQATSQPSPYRRPYMPLQNSFRNQMIYCPLCKSVNNFNAFYCRSCGSPLHKMLNQQS